MEKEILKVQDVQKFLRISRSKAYSLVNSAEFPIIKIGNDIRIERTAFFRWLDSKKVQYGFQDEKVMKEAIKWEIEEVYLEKKKMFGK